MPRPADSRELATVIGEFLQAAEDGRVRRADRARYGRDDLRALRGALSHVASDLGTRGVDAISALQIQSLIYRLRDAGLPQRRGAAIVEALYALFAYAIQRRLVKTSPVIDLPVPEEEVPEFEVPIREPGARVRDNGTRTRDASTRTRDADTRVRDAENLIRDTGTRIVEATRTPTDALLLLGEHVARWTVRAIVIAFVLLALALAFALA